MSKRTCNFCGKTQPEVSLVADKSDRSFICNNCVEEAVDIFTDARIQPFDRVRESIDDNLKLHPIFGRPRATLIVKKCFYLGPFTEPFNTIYTDHVKPALVSAAYTVSRADEIYGTSPIIQDIWEGITSAELVVADVSGRNPNVMYEVGIAHTVGTPVCILTQAIDDVPFDLRHHRCVIYSYTPRGCRELEERIIKTVSSVLSMKSSVSK